MVRLIVWLCARLWDLDTKKMLQICLIFQNYKNKKPFLLYIQNSPVYLHFSKVKFRKFTFSSLSPLAGLAISILSVADSQTDSETLFLCSSFTAWKMFLPRILHCRRCFSASMLKVLCEVRTPEWKLQVPAFKTLVLFENAALKSSKREIRHNEMLLCLHLTFCILWLINYKSRVY